MRRKPRLFCGHAVNAAYPAFEATVVVIDDLNVEDTVDNAWAMLDVERPMGNPGGASNGGINASTVGTQNRLLIDQRTECRDDVDCIEFFQFELSGLPTAVAYREYRNLFGTEAALAGHAAPVTGWPQRTKGVSFAFTLFIRAVFIFSRSESKIGLRFTVD